MCPLHLYPYKRNRAPPKTTQRMFVTKDTSYLHARDADLFSLVNKSVYRKRIVKGGIVVERSAGKTGLCVHCCVSSAPLVLKRI